MSKRKIVFYSQDYLTWNICNIVDYQNVKTQIPTRADGCFRACGCFISRFSTMGIELLSSDGMLFLGFILLLTIGGGLTFWK